MSSPCRTLRAVVVDDDGSPLRAELERLAARVFARAYDAHVESFLSTLIGLRDEDDGRWLGVIGYRGVGSGSVSLVEQYLAQPVHVELGARLGEVVQGVHLAEVGHLAVAGCDATRTGARTARGAGRWLVGVAAIRLLELGKRWAVCAATRDLRRTFARLAVPTVDLGAADPARLPGAGAGWGRYYDTDPRVIAVAIEAVAEAVFPGRERAASGARGRSAPDRRGRRPRSARACRASVRALDRRPTPGPTPTPRAYGIEVAA